MKPALRLIGVGNTLVGLATVRGHYEAVCFGPRCHYRTAGDCRHIEALLNTLPDWHRRRTRIDPFGGKR